MLNLLLFFFINFFVHCTLSSAISDFILEEWEYRSFVYGNYIDEVVQYGIDLNVDGNIDERYYYHTDDLFNVMALTDNNRNIVESYDYDEFGIPTETTSLCNPFLFNGREYDTENGFYNYRTRYLDPSVGRFTTRDTIGIWGDPSNLGNGYTYVANNPQTYNDPYGEIIPALCAIGYYAIWGAGGGLLFGVAAYETPEIAANLTEGRPVLENVNFDQDRMFYDFLGGAAGGGLSRAVSPLVSPGIRHGKSLLGFGDDALNSADDAVRAVDDLDFPNNTGTPKSPTGSKPDCDSCDEVIIDPNHLTGKGYGVNDPPVRIQGAWTLDDYKTALRGSPPRSLGSPHLHHADQLPGSGIHEIIPQHHLNNRVLHPSGNIGLGVTEPIRRQDRNLHWWYRAREMGADKIFPNDIYK